MSGPVVGQADREAAMIVLMQRLTKIKDWQADKRDALKARIARIKCHMGDDLAEVQSAAIARHRQQSAAPHLAAMEAAAEALAPFAKLGDMANFAFAPALFADSESLKELPWSEDGKPVTATFGDVRKATKALTQLTAALEAARKGD